MEIHLNMEPEPAEKNDDQILLRLPKTLKTQIETAAKLEGITSQEWIRKAVSYRVSLLNVCPSCGTINISTAKYCNECGTSLKESKRTLYMEWMAQNLEEEFGEMGRQLFSDWMKLVDDPEAQIKSIDKDGKWVVVTRKHP